MASVPPRQIPAQRRSSLSEPSPSNAATEEVQPRTQDISTVSVDSETVLLNDPEPTKEDTQATNESSSTSGAQTANDNDPRKCWICMCDETEDTPTSGVWRSPCQCALTAHEPCLLDWVADMEAPSSSRNTVTSSKVQCPQCKNEIVLSRPRSLVVEGVNVLERTAAYLVAPGVLIVLTYAINQACEIHGINTIYSIFGPDDGDHILSPMLTRKPIVTGFRGSLVDHMKEVAQRFSQHWRLDIGLPLIPPLLIVSRMRFADSILPILPLIFFATQADTSESLDLSHWPPSAALSFAALPYIRGIYNAYYEKVWAKKEVQWIKEVQPRQGQESNGNGAGNAEPAPNEEEDDVLEIDLGVGEGDGLLDGWNNNGDANEGEAAQDLPQEQPARPNVPPVDANAEDPAAAARGDDPAQAQVNANHAQGQQPNNAPRRQPREHRLRMSLLTIASKFLGALVFPTISSTVGELLRVSLPKTWVTAPIIAGKPKPTGFLQLRWARSLVGGCIFVVVRDAMMLYVRWRQAQGHRHRRVLDYGELKKKGLAKGPKKGRAGT
ncbi:MAG: hypothetical protein M1820_003135 [Bogoriella megaspora]|nr:MAG: hypothetical protein M1820_003135 [Bogoriella megaspora]